RMDELGAREKKGLLWAAIAMLVSLGLFALSLIPATSPWRAPESAGVYAGQLAVAQAPVMQSIVALIFIFFLIPGVVYGYAAGTVKSHRDVIAGMAKAMSGMGYYIVMAF